MFKVSLVLRNEEKRGQRVDVVDDQLTIGRGDDCSLRLRSNQVSRRHCIIVRDDDAVLIRDLGSRNGTYVNGEILGDDERQLWHRDKIQIGPWKFRVSVRDAESGAAIKRPTDSSSDAIPPDSDLSEGSSALERNTPPDTENETANGDPDQVATDLLNHLNEMTTQLEISLEKSQRGGWRELAAPSRDTSIENDLKAEPGNTRMAAQVETLQDVESDRKTTIDQGSSSGQSLESSSDADGNQSESSREPQRLPEHLKESSADSQDAAARALRRHFGGR